MRARGFECQSDPAIGARKRGPAPGFRHSAQTRALMSEGVREWWARERSDRPLKPRNPAGTGRRFADLSAGEMVAMCLAYEWGLGVAEIAQALGSSQPSVSAWLRRCGVILRRVGGQGEGRVDTPDWVPGAFEREFERLAQAYGARLASEMIRAAMKAQDAGQDERAAA